MSFFSELRRRNVFRVAIAYSVTGWLVAQIAELALDSFGAPDWVMKTILLLLVLGFPFALLFAWAFEMTPEGLKREKDVDRSQSITRQTGQKLNFAIIGILAVALVFSLATRDWGTAEQAAPPATAAEAEPADGEKSIAVLPFVNMSQDPDNEYFSDGISEELLNVLVKVEGLRVASRTSAFSFKGKDIPIPEIAKALNVDHVLEGSVRKAGDTVRVTAQLIDVKTDSHLWSETYDRKLEDIFVIQDEISAHIVEALKVALGAGQSDVIAAAAHTTDSLEAYELFLKARYFWQRRGDANIRKAIELFQRATEIDPKFARAWAGLAAAHLTLPAYSAQPDMTHWDVARIYANKALQLDETIADAYAVLGDLDRTGKNYLGGEEYFRKAIALEPKNSTSHLWYAEHLLIAGMREKAKQHIDIALQLDPLNPGANAVAAGVAGALGNHEAQLHYDLAAWDLGHNGALADAIGAHLSQGNFEEARRLNESNKSMTPPGFYEGVGKMIEAYVNPDVRAEILAPDEDPNWWLQSWVFVVPLTVWGDVDRAYEIALRAEPPLNGLMDVWRSNMGPFRADPRFQQIAARANWIEYWDRYGWPSLCQRTGETITCR